MADSVVAQMKDLNLTVSRLPKLPPGNKGKKKEMETNSFVVKLPPKTPFYLYSVDIEAEFDRKDGETLRREVTKKTRDDYLEMDRKKTAMKTFIHISNVGFLGVPSAYDRAALLISLHEIKQIKNSETEEMKIVLSRDNSDLFQLESIKGADRIVIVIKKAADTFQVSSEDLHSMVVDLQPLLNVVAIVTSQNFFRDVRYIVYRTGLVYLMDPATLRLPEYPSGSNEKYIGQGFFKGADIIESGKGRAIALTIDAKKTAFHYDYQLLSEKIQNLGMDRSLAFLNAHLKGVRCVVRYPGENRECSRERTVVICSFSGPCQNVTFDVNGKIVTMLEFVRKVHNTTLTNLSLPSVITRRGTFSPEVLLVAPNQRVRTEQMQQSVQDRVIKASASKPCERRAEISLLRNTIQPPREFGISVEGTPMKAPGRILTAPSIETGRGTVQSNNGSWTVNRFVRGAECKNWTIAFIKTRGDRVDLITMSNAILKRSAELGMKLGQPRLIEENARMRQEDKQTKELVRQSKANGSTFILFITSKNVHNHDALKDAECEFGIVTQQIVSENAAILHMRPSTLSNILKKTNEKLGGANIAITSPDLPQWMLSESTMIIGMTIENPRPQTRDDIEKKLFHDRPSIISWSINAVKGRPDEHTQFTGGYVYALPVESKLTPSQSETKRHTMIRIVESFMDCKGIMPEHVLLIRRVNEGDSKVIFDEIAQLMSVFSSMGISKLVVVTASVTHSNRLFDPNMDRRARPADQNLESGAILDTKITSPTKNEFFLQAHVPRQGTARPTKFELLYADDEKSISMDDIEAAMFSLCHAHAVCDMTTALPTPLKVSEEYAKRALNLFNYKQRETRGWEQERLNKELAIQPKSTLDMIRTNA